MGSRGILGGRGGLEKYFSGGLFPPYFVAGAIYSGFAMVLTLAIPIRHFYKLEDFITMRHLENMAKVLLATGLIVAYGYMMETFGAFYSGNPLDKYMILNRMEGPYAFVYWVLIACNIAIPQLLWFRGIRTSVPALFVIALVVNVGMWLERFVIVVTSLTVISCRLRGACIILQNGTGPLLWARSDCS